MNLYDERQLFITNLLVETLPDEYLTKESLDELSLLATGSYIILHMQLSNVLKSKINDMDLDTINRWKSDFHSMIVDTFNNAGFESISLLNLQPYTRTLVIGIDTPSSHELEDLQTAFETLSTSLIDNFEASITGFFGNVVQGFFKLGDSYKKSRRLQEYRYVIGKGKCAFFDLYIPNDDYSLIEYKYIHHFESLFKEKDWIQIHELLKKLKNKLLTNHVNDSKTIYIYKELFSITIRQLFDQLDEHKDSIQELNEGIINFEHIFDDIEEVNIFYLKIFDSITQVPADQPLHLYVKKILYKIASDYREALSLSMFADSFNISLAYLSRLFKDEIGVGFKEYLTDYRMNKAKELLENSDKDIKEIGIAIGYPSSTQFARAFKTHEGMTPSEYRLNT